MNTALALWLHWRSSVVLPLRSAPPTWCATTCAPASSPTSARLVCSLLPFSTHRSMICCHIGELHFWLNLCDWKSFHFQNAQKNIFCKLWQQESHISVVGGGGGGDGNRLTIFPWRLCVSDVDIVSLLMVWMWCWHFLSPYGVCVMLTFSLSLQSVCGVDMFSVLAACVWCWHVLCPGSLCVVLTCSLSLQPVCGVDMFSVLAACVWCWHVLCPRSLCVVLTCSRPCSLCVVLTSSLSLQPVRAGGAVQQIRGGEDAVQAAIDDQTETEPAQREEARVHHHPSPWSCGPHPWHRCLPP